MLLCVSLHNNAHLPPLLHMHTLLYISIDIKWTTCHPPFYTSAKGTKWSILLYVLLSWWATFTCVLLGTEHTSGTFIHSEWTVLVTAKLLAWELGVSAASLYSMYVLSAFTESKHTAPLLFFLPVSINYTSNWAITWFGFIPIMVESSILPLKSKACCYSKISANYSFTEKCSFVVTQTTCLFGSNSANSFSQRENKRIW